MPLWLVDDQFRLTIEIPLAERIENALKVQESRRVEDDRFDFERRLANGVATAIEAALDMDLRAPTERQIAFATAVAKALAVPLPSETLTSRRAIGQFLDAHSGSFKSRAKISR